VPNITENPPPHFLAASASNTTLLPHDDQVFKQSLKKLVSVCSYCMNTMPSCVYHYAQVSNLLC